MAEIIDCKAITAAVKQKVADGLKACAGKKSRLPKAAFILVGSNEYSARYVGIKNNACKDAGFEILNYHFSGDLTQQELIDTIVKLNNDPSVDGILVQMPLPAHIDEFKIKNAIDKQKDIDGLSAENMFNTVFGKGGHIPCLPGGILYILDLFGINVSKKTVVIVGKSDITSIPLLNVFSNLCADAVFTYHASQNLQKLVSMADVLVSCCNMPQVIKSEWLKEGAIVFDAGNTSITDPSKKAGYRVVGDVEFLPDECRARYITPVPGGLGPLSIAMLVNNIFNAYSQH